MRLFARSRPSPAMVVAVVALSFALAGSAVAGTDAVISDVSKKQVKKIAKKQGKKQAKKQIRKKAPGLRVDHANTAGHAETANQANAATNATNATNATRANNANAPFAFARVDADGTITNPATARNIGSANISNPAAGVYCFELPFTPITGQATSQAQNGADDIAMIEIASATVTLDQCPASAEVEVNNYDVSTGAQANENFNVELGI